MALVGLKPWGGSSVTPRLGGTPDLGVALGDAKAVAQDGGAGVADARVASSGPAVLAATPVAVSAPAETGSHPALAVSRAEAVEGGSSSPVAAVPVQSPSVPSTPPATEPVSPGPGSTVPSEPAAAPALVAGVGGESPGAPVASGGGDIEGEPDRACEGDEYAIALSLEAGEILSEESEVDIVVKHLESDGGESEFNLHGSLLAVRDLIAQLVSEGNCVTVAIDRSDGDEVAEEVPGVVGAETAALAEPLELASP